MDLAKILCAALEYDQTTGTLYHKRVPAEMVRERYKLVRAGALTIAAHRAAWILAHGPIPENLVVHHKDGDGLNNRLSNLELVTRSKNQQVARRRQLNACGHRNIYRERDGAYSVRVSKDKVRTYLGRFRTLQEAQQVLAEFWKST